MSVERLIVVVEIKEGHPSPLAVFGYQVKAPNGEQSYEIGDLVEVDLLNGVTVRGRVKEIFTQILTAKDFCPMKRFVQVRNGEGVAYDRAFTMDMDTDPASRRRAAILSQRTSYGVPTESKSSVGSYVETMRARQSQARATNQPPANQTNPAQTASESRSALVSLLKEPNNIR